ncbi:MAG: hypothetical protein IT223_06530 [Crocinitomicaceae bacterium]|nr:hypothetical protein [Crocinitomicaceae bacterium]
MKYISTLFLLIFFINCSAQFNKVSVEEVDNGGNVPGRTYRVYIELLNDSDQVHMVYGEAQHPLDIRSSKPFYQSEYGGALSNQVNRKASKENAGLRFDSWITIGATDNYDNQTTNFLINVDDFEKKGGAIKTSDGAWFVTPGNPQAYAGSAQRVLIMQLTTEGKITGKFSIMGRTKSGEIFHQYDIGFTAGK